jgi:hypothetical protein
MERRLAALNLVLMQKSQVRKKRDFIEIYDVADRPYLIMLDNEHGIGFYICELTGFAVKYYRHHAPEHSKNIRELLDQYNIPNDSEVRISIGTGICIWINELQYQITQDSFDIIDLSESEVLYLAKLFFERTPPTCWHDKT